MLTIHHFLCRWTRLTCGSVNTRGIHTASDMEMPSHACCRCPLLCRWTQPTCGSAARCCPIACRRRSTPWSRPCLRHVARRTTPAREPAFAVAQACRACSAPQPNVCQAGLEKSCLQPQQHPKRCSLA